MRYTNNEGIALPIAVWLADDTYDHNADPFYISATTLMKTVRQIVLTRRIPESLALVDVSSLIASRMGTAFHDSIEDSWKNRAAETLVKLGYPKKVAKRVRINVPPDQLEKGDIPFYLEQRTEKQVGKWTVAGKFDFVMEGRVEDFKSTGVFAYMSGKKDADYELQGSIYRWLNPDIITEEQMRIHFIFTDWSKLRSIQEKDKGYPQRKIEHQKFNTMHPRQTEEWVRGKLIAVEEALDLPEANLPLCDDKALWRAPTQYKYYKDPTARAAGKRSTKNFDTYHDAYLRFTQDGSVGEVYEAKGKVMACKYCDAFELCSQKDYLIAAGDLDI